MRPGGVVTVDTLHHDAGVRHYTPAPDAVAVQLGDDTMIELWTFRPGVGADEHRADRTSRRGGEEHGARFRVWLPTPPEWVVWLKAAGFRDVHFQAGGGRNRRLSFGRHG